MGVLGSCEVDFLGGGVMVEVVGAGGVVPWYGEGWVLPELRFDVPRAGLGEGSELGRVVRAWESFDEAGLPGSLRAVFVEQELGWARRQCVAVTPGLPERWVRFLAGDPDRYVRAMVAANVSCGPDVFRGLVAWGDWCVVMAALANPQLPVEFLESFAADADFFPRELVAGNRATPPWLLERFVDDEHAWVAHSAIENPSMPERVLRRLFEEQESSWDLLALNPASPRPMLEVIAGSGGLQAKAARARLAGEPVRPVVPSRLPLEVLGEVVLGHRGEDVVVRVVGVRGVRPWYGLGWMPPELRHRVPRDEVEAELAGVEPSPLALAVQAWEAGDEDELPDVLRGVFLENHLDARHRRDAAGYAELAPQWKHRFAGDSRAVVRTSAAGNQGADPADLVVLASDTERNVVRRALRNARTPPEVLVEHATSDVEDWRASVAGNPSTPPGVLGPMAKDTSPRVRESLAGNPSAPPDALEALLADRRTYLALARNPACPERVRDVIAETGDEEARAAARGEMGC